MSLLENLARVKELLASTGCSLAVVTADGEELTFSRRGVDDLYDICRERPDLLRGAVVADKIIGVAAAALIARCGAKAVYTPAITERALRLLFGCGVLVTYGSIAPYVINRAGTGRCPLDTLLHTVPQNVSLIIEAIQKFKSA